MPQNVVDADTWTDPVQCAADGESVDGASQLLVAQDVADRTNFLYRRAGFGVGYQAIMSDPAYNANTRFSFDNALAVWKQSDVTDAGETWWPLIVRPYLELISVTVRLEGSAGHAGVPGTMPQVSVVRNDDGILTTYGPQVDSSGAPAAYQLPHDVTLAIANIPQDVGQLWWVVLEGEDGANKQVGLEVLNILARYDI